MSQNEVSSSKRKFLIAATTAVGGVATVGVAIPFLASWSPSQRAKAAGAPVEVDISKLEPGTLMTVAWRGKPVWVVNRNQEQMDALSKHNDKLSDPQSEVTQQPEYCQNATRSRQEHPNILVVIGVCTHLGCSPSQKLKSGPLEGMVNDWPGGFFCPCHGSRFDLAARVFQGSPAPTNLVIPPYKYLSDSLILVGDDSKGA
jgi:ubiquinol-cytochrome c reductase iron-sulfur subunit